MASKNKKSVLTPKGRINYPYLVSPDTGREYSDDAYKLDFLIEKDLFIGSELEKAIEEIAVAEFGAAKAKKVKRPQKFLQQASQLTFTGLQNAPLPLIQRMNP